MSKDHENENKNVQTPPAVESWIGNVIVPALVKSYLAELKKIEITPQGSAVKDKKAIQVEEQGTVPRQALEDKNMLTVAEAARSLGLSQAIVRAWIANRRLTYVRLGRAIRIPSKAPYLQSKTVSFPRSGDVDWPRRAMVHCGCSLRTERVQSLVAFLYRTDPRSVEWLYGGSLH